MIFFPFRFLDVRDKDETFDAKDRHVGLPITFVRLVDLEGIRRKVAVDKTDDKEVANVMFFQRYLLPRTAVLFSFSFFKGSIGC